LEIYIIVVFWDCGIKINNETDRSYEKTKLRKSSFEVRYINKPILRNVIWEAQWGETFSTSAGKLVIRNVHATSRLSNRVSSLAKRKDMTRVDESNVNERIMLITWEE